MQLSAKNLIRIIGLIIGLVILGKGIATIVDVVDDTSSDRTYLQEYASIKVVEKPYLEYAGPGDTDDFDYYNLHIKILNTGNKSYPVSYLQSDIKLASGATKVYSDDNNGKYYYRMIDVLPPGQVGDYCVGIKIYNNMSKLDIEVDCDSYSDSKDESDHVKKYTLKVPSKE